MPRYTRPTARASLIAEIPHDERPRERLLRKGPQSLSDAELVAILLRNGRPGASVLEVAREVLAEAGGLTGLSTACTRSLRRRGVGEVKIATLLAAVEIACRMASAAVPEREVLSKPEVVARYVYLGVDQGSGWVVTGAARAPQGRGGPPRGRGGRPTTVGEAQAALAGIALELVGIEDRLRRIAASLPVPADLDAMLEGRAPRDVVTEVVAKVLCVADDDIGSAVETLETVARVTAEDLRAAWRSGR